MPISQQIGSSSLAKPGVCTSTTRPASPYEGQMIYETDTDRILYWSGSAWKITGGQMPICTIQAGANQTGIVANTWTQLTFPTTTVIRNNAGFTVSNGAITVPSGLSGIYHVFAQIQWDSSTNGGVNMHFAQTDWLYNGFITGTGTASGDSSYARTMFSGIVALGTGIPYCCAAIQSGTVNRGLEIAYMPQYFSITMLSAL